MNAGGQRSVVAACAECASSGDVLGNDGALFSFDHVACGSGPPNFLYLTCTLRFCQKLLTSFGAFPRLRRTCTLKERYRIELLQQLDPEQFSEPQACWAQDFKWQCFEDFEHHLIEHAMQWFTTPERYYEAAKVIFEGSTRA